MVRCSICVLCCTVLPFEKATYVQMVQTKKVSLISDDTHPIYRGDSALRKQRPHIMFHDAEMIRVFDSGLLRGSKTKNALMLCYAKLFKKSNIAFQQPKPKDFSFSYISREITITPIPMQMQFHTLSFHSPDCIVQLPPLVIDIVLADVT